MNGFLAWLFLLVFMDDTVLLSTSRGNMVGKINLLNQLSASHRMKINENKTIFFVVNGNDADREVMHIDT